MATAFARYLPEFDPAGEKPYDFGAGIKPLGTPVERRQASDPLVEAEERGRQAGKAAAEAEHEKARKADRAAFEQRLVAERKAWVEGEADRLAILFQDGVLSVEARLAEEIVTALRPFADEALRRRAVEELRVVLLGLLAGNEHAMVEVEGPADLLAALEQRLDAAAKAIRFVAGSGPDVRVVADDTVIETRIGAWGEWLRRAMDGADV